MSKDEDFRNILALMSNSNTISPNMHVSKAFQWKGFKRHMAWKIKHATKEACGGHLKVTINKMASF